MGATSIFSTAATELRQDGDGGFPTTHHCSRSAAEHLVPGGGEVMDGKCCWINLEKILYIYIYGI